MKQKVNAVTDFAPMTNITESGHTIGLIGYYRKFFPIFINIIWPLNELTKMTVPFRLNKYYQKGLIM